MYLSIDLSWNGAKTFVTFMSNFYCLVGQAIPCCVYLGSSLIHVDSCYGTITTINYLSGPKKGSIPVGLCVPPGLTCQQIARPDNLGAGLDLV